MKKLLKNSTIALLFLGFFAASCDKEEPAKPKPTPEATITWTPVGERNPTVADGNIEDGVRGIVYQIKPTWKDFGCPGKWTFIILAPKNSFCNGVIDPKDGTVSFIALSAGTYTIRITFVCQDGSTFTVERSITIK